LIRDAAEEGFTADALELVLNAAHQTVTARLRELELEGLIKDSGQRRPTRRRRQAVVYVAMEAA
jgi:Fic family protein